MLPFIRKVAPLKMAETCTSIIIWMSPFSVLQRKTEEIFKRNYKEKLSAFKKKQKAEVLKKVFFPKERKICWEQQ